MNKTFFKFFLTVTFLLLNFIAFAQGQGDGNGDFEAEDEPTAPLNTKLFWLCILGVAFAYYSLRKTRTAIVSK